MLAWVAWAVFRDGQNSVEREGELLNMVHGMET